MVSSSDSRYSADTSAATVWPSWAPLITGKDGHGFQYGPAPAEMGYQRSGQVHGQLLSDVGVDNPSGVVRPG